MRKFRRDFNVTKHFCTSCISIENVRFYVISRNNKESSSKFMLMIHLMCIAQPLSNECNWKVTINPIQTIVFHFVFFLSLISDLILELRHLCNDDKQCDDDLICSVDNATKSTGFNRNPSSSAPKICLCDEENGYSEDVEDNNCNGKHYSNAINNPAMPFSFLVFIYPLLISIKPC